MRKVVYLLSDGTVVNTLDKAMNSRQNFDVVVEEIPTPPTKLSDKRKAWLKGLFKRQRRPLPHSFHKVRISAPFLRGRSSTKRGRIFA